MRTLVIALSCLVAVGAVAEEKKIPESEVPRAVLDGVTKKYPEAKKIGFEREIEKGKTVFEVQLMNGGHKVDVDVSPEGNILEEEEEIAFDSAPEPVRKALSSSAKYAKWTVKRTERVVTGGNTSAPRYELVVASGKEKTELVFSADGKLLRSED